MKLTRDDVMQAIKDVQYHQFPGTVVTVCCLTLTNGFNATGTSACVDPADFDAETGKKIAFENAFNEAWMLEGYMLKQRLFCFGK